MKLNKLKGKMVENEVNVESLADALGVDRSTMYRKLNEADKITIGEAMKIKAVLSLTDEEATDIFLA